jgi:hypothetical protein
MAGWTVERAYIEKHFAPVPRQIGDVRELAAPS